MTSVSKLVLLARQTDHPLKVRFFCQPSGNEPVRDWLRALDSADKKLIGEDIKIVQWGWPIGMPVVRLMGGGLCEVRTDLDKRIARVLFCIKDDKIVLLHGFIKKNRKTPPSDIKLARGRMAKL